MTTDDELIERLKYIAAILEANASRFAVPDHIPAKVRTIDAAADRISLLREALEPFAKLAGTYTVETAPGLLTLSNGERMCGIEAEAFRRARQALASSGGGG